MKQGKLEVVIQDMAGVNIDISGISELKWTRMGEFNTDDHYIYYCGQESLKRSRIALIVKRRVQSAVLGCNLKNDRMISVHFQSKLFNITVIQVYVPTTVAKKAEIEQFYDDLQDLLELTPKKDGPFHRRVQFRLVTQSCPTLCHPMNCSTPGLPVHHQLPEFTQTHGHRVGDAIQPSHPLLSPSPPALNLPQHQGLFK